MLKQEIEDTQKQIEMSETQRIKELFTVYWKCLLVGCALQFFQQFCGINTVMYYGPKIILSTGLKIEGMSQERMAIIFNIPLAAMNAIGSTIAILIIDSKGRRFIMLRTLPG